jgi:hypothetical protein
MSRKHFYENHEEVIEILTTKYGFTYTGLGDNYEECFHKDSDTPETIFVHPMFCSYYMSVGRHWSDKRVHEVEFKSNHRVVREQKNAFHLLCAHLDKFTIELPQVAIVEKTNDNAIEPQKPDIEIPTFVNVMMFNKHLLPLFREKFTKGTISLGKCLSVLGLTEIEYSVMIKED